MRPLYRLRTLARRLPQQGPKRPALDASGSNFHSRGGEDLMKSRYRTGNLRSDYQRKRECRSNL
jgi:hypothetical protein